MNSIFYGTLIKYDRLNAQEGSIETKTFFYHFLPTQQVQRLVQRCYNAKVLLWQHYNNFTVNLYSY